MQQYQKAQMRRLSRSNIHPTLNPSPQPSTRPAQPQTILTVLNSFEKAKQQLQETRKRNQQLQRTVSTLRNPRTLPSQNQCPNVSDNSQSLRQKIRQLQRDNRMQLKNVQCLQGILAAKEKENIVLKEDLKKADLAMRAEWVRMEEFKEGLEEKYKSQVSRLEEVNRELQQRLGKLKKKSVYEEILFELTDDEDERQLNPQ